MGLENSLLSAFAQILRPKCRYHGGLFWWSADCVSRGWLCATTGDMTLAVLIHQPLHLWPVYRRSSANFGSRFAFGMIAVRLLRLDQAVPIAHTAAIVEC